MNQENLSINSQDYIMSFFDILNTMIQGMYNASLSCSLSTNFINQMVPHHRGAIQMSYNLLNYTTNVPLQNIALNIISEQTKSIENLLQSHFCCIQYINTLDDLNQYTQSNEQIIHEMYARMNHAPQTNNIDINFINEMIPHHEGAIQMSQNLLQYNICPELIPILESIISSQQRGIQQMKSLLSQITQQN